jgi:hypothetical protein
LNTLETEEEKNLETLNYYHSLSQVITNKKSEKEVKEEFEKFHIVLDNILESFEQQLAEMNKLVDQKE